MQTFKSLAEFYPEDVRLCVGPFLDPCTVWKDISLKHIVDGCYKLCDAKLVNRCVNPSVLKVLQVFGDLKELLKQDKGGVCQKVCRELLEELFASRLGTEVSSATVTAEELRSVLSDDTKARLYKILHAFVRKSQSIGTVAELVLEVAKEGLPDEPAAKKAREDLPEELDAVGFQVGDLVLTAVAKSMAKFDGRVAVVSKIMKSQIRVTLKNGPAAGEEKDYDPANLKPHISEEQRQANKAKLAASLFGEVL